jgi:hypothetical protein
MGEKAAVTVAVVGIWEVVSKGITIRSRDKLKYEGRLKEVNDYVKKVEERTTLVKP